MSKNTHKIGVGITVLSPHYLKCERCYKLLPDVGKIKEFPDICLRCADAVRYLIENKIAPNGSFKDWTEWENQLKEDFKDSPLLKMETTKTINGFNLVYMPEEKFKEIYREKLNAQIQKNKSLKDKIVDDFGSFNEDFQKTQIEIVDVLIDVAEESGADRD